jgi:hypothetical protein
VITWLVIYSLSAARRYLETFTVWWRVQFGMSFIHCFPWVRRPILTPKPTDDGESSNCEWFQMRYAIVRIIPEGDVLLTLLVNFTWDYVSRKKKKTWFQASAAMLMRSALFWGITRRRVLIVYGRFGTKYLSHLHRSRVLIREDGTDTLFRNVGKQLPYGAA